MKLRISFLMIYMALFQGCRTSPSHPITEVKSVQESYSQIEYNLNFCSEEPIISILKDTQKTHHSKSKFLRNFQNDYEILLSTYYKDLIEFYATKLILQQELIFKNEFYPAESNNKHDIKLSGAIIDDLFEDHACLNTAPYKNKTVAKAAFASAKYKYLDKNEHILNLPGLMTNLEIQTQCSSEYALQKYERLFEEEKLALELELANICDNKNLVEEYLLSPDHAAWFFYRNESNKTILDLTSHKVAFCAQSFAEQNYDDMKQKEKLEFAFFVAYGGALTIGSAALAPITGGASWVFPDIAMLVTGLALDYRSTELIEKRLAIAEDLQKMSLSAGCQASALKAELDEINSDLIYHFVGFVIGASVGYTIKGIGPALKKLIKSGVASLKMVKSGSIIQPILEINIRNTKKMLVLPNLGQMHSVLNAVEDFMKKNVRGERMIVAGKTVFNNRNLAKLAQRLPTIAFRVRAFTEEYFLSSIDGKLRVTND